MADALKASVIRPSFTGGARIFMSLDNNAILEGKVIRITNFGAFVQVGENSIGMVHISEISNSYVKDINEHVKLNDTVKVLVLGTDESGRINLSIRRALPPEQRPRESFAPKRMEAPATFDDMLTRFMKDSEERLLDYKRNTGRKGGGYSRTRG